VSPPRCERRCAGTRSPGRRLRVRVGRQAVRVVAAGGTFLTPQLGARIAAAPPEASGPPDDLTEREVEILRLIALGHTNTEIAAQLYLSVRTVESHRGHIQHKISLTSRAELVHYALEHGLIVV
jgi:two-component system response regulator NreC